MKLLSTLMRRARAGDRGQVLPLVALSLVVLLGMAALAVDIGYLRFEQRVQQIATDSAAIAGASECAYTPASRVTSGAQQDATLNGYTDGAAGVTVTVNNPPASGAYAGRAPCPQGDITSVYAVEVIITKQDLPLFFAGVLTAAKPVVTTRAVAVLNRNELECVYALNGDITLHGGGGGGIIAPTCGILTNANLVVTGNANVDARYVGYVGSWTGGGSIPPSGGQPTKISIPVADPCKMFPSCAYLAALNVNTVPCKVGIPNSAALAPGHYCGSALTDVTFAPIGGALYVFDHLPSGNMSGTGVTIYNNSGSGITWNGNTSVIVKAPTSGPTSGMAYFQPVSNAGDITKNGNAGTIDFEGGFYAPSADVTLNGDLPSVSLFVAASIRMDGGGMTVGNSPGLVQVGHAALAE